MSNNNKSLFSRRMSKRATIEQLKAMGDDALPVMIEGDGANKAAESARAMGKIHPPQRPKYPVKHWI